MNNFFQLCEPSYDSKWNATPQELDDLVVTERLYLYDRALACGAKEIQKRVAGWGVINVPSLSTIGRLLRKNGLTYARRGWVEGEDNNPKTWRASIG